MSQSVYVNGKFMKSITSAAKFLRMPMSTLAEMLRNKKSTIYKDVFIEKAEETPQIIKKQKVGKGGAGAMPIIVDGVRYNSMNEAERAVGLGENTLSHAVRRKSGYCKGHKIELVYPERLKPMNTKNVYKNTGKNYRHRETKSLETDPKNRFISCETLNKIDVGNFCEPLTEVNFDKKEVPQIVKDAINEKIISMLKDNGLYEDIVNLLNYGGFSTIKITKE